MTQLDVVVDLGDVSGMLTGSELDNEINGLGGRVTYSPKCDFSHENETQEQGINVGVRINAVKVNGFKVNAPCASAENLEKHG